MYLGIKYCFFYTALLTHTKHTVYLHYTLLTYSHTLPYHMPSILRKRKSQHKVSEPAPLRPSLSLPDITSPLLDTSTWGWDEVPPLVTSHTVRTTPSPSERNRKPSLVRDPNSPVQFHRPFTPWQVVDTTPNRHGVASYQGNGGNGNFRDTANGEQVLPGVRCQSQRNEAGNEARFQKVSTSLWRAARTSARRGKSFILLSSS